MKYLEKSFSVAYGGKAYNDGYDKIDWSGRDCKHAGANVMRSQRVVDGITLTTWVCQDCGAVWEDSGDRDRP